MHWLRMRKDMWSFKNKIRKRLVSIRKSLKIMKDKCLNLKKTWNNSITILGNKSPMNNIYSMTYQSNKK